jgi:hypothetical protein
LDPPRLHTRSTRHPRPCTPAGANGNQRGVASANAIAPAVATAGSGTHAGALE